jgi:hypothetical protein
VVALHTLAVPDHQPAFWDELGDQLADEPQLRLRPRAAVRPITQPPPIVDDRLPFDDGDPAFRGPSRPRRRRIIVWLVAIVLSALLIISALGESDDPPDALRSGGTSTTESVPGSEGTAAPTEPTDPPPPVDVVAALTPSGVGPLTIGTSLRSLESAGMDIAVDEPTFTGSGGACFDATVARVGDLVLRFRSPDPSRGVTAPGDAVLASVAVDVQLGSYRATETGIGLRSAEDELRAAYPPGGLVESDNPFGLSGQVFTFVPEGVGNGLAFMTDGAAVTSIVVGAADIIGYPEGCPS